MAGNIPDLLHSAYAALRGAETNRILSPVTLDHLLQEHIDAIQGGASRTLLSAAGTEMNANRLSKLDAIDIIEQTVEAVVAAVEEAGDDPQKLAALGFDTGATTV